MKRVLKFWQGMTAIFVVMGLGLLLVQVLVWHHESSWARWAVTVATCAAILFVGCLTLTKSE